MTLIWVAVKVACHMLPSFTAIDVGCRVSVSLLRSRVAVEVVCHHVVCRC